MPEIATDIWFLLGIFTGGVVGHIFARWTMDKFDMFKPKCKKIPVNPTQPRQFKAPKPYNTTPEEARKR